MCKTKQHKKQKHEQNHVYINVEKESVQQLSENMQLRLKRQLHQKIREEVSQPTLSQKIKKNESID
jgi:hypothetical protein